MAKLMPGLERRLRREMAGDVLFGHADRGRYATDASHYQMMPVGVVVPRTIEEANAKRADENIVLEDLHRATRVVAGALSDLLA